MFEPTGLPVEEQFLHHKEFHSAILDGAGNTLLRIAAQPIFSVLRTNLSREAMSPGFAERVDQDHRAICTAIERGDDDAAAAEMDRHLSFLSQTYTSMWHPRAIQERRRPQRRRGATEAR
jgi:DNA-binding FadR family transcriptional regulator